MAFANDPEKPWTWSPQKSAEYFKEKSDKIRSFCRQDDSRQSFSTDGDSSTYNFENRYRGLALILNNEKFKERSRDRIGAATDRKNLVESFKKLGFDVIVFDNLTASQLEEAAKVAANSYKHQEADCFVCAVLSHGREEKRDDGYHLVVDGSDAGSDKKVSTHIIIKTFDTEELKNKPKLFFIQACRGVSFDDGVVSSETKNRDRPRPSGSTDRQDAEPVEEDPGNNQITACRGVSFDDGVVSSETKNRDRPRPSGSTDRQDAEPVEEDPGNNQITACRGRSFDGGVLSSKTNRNRSRRSGSTDRQDGQPGNQQITVNAVPLYQDCLIMYGTPPGYFAWRSPTDGSWFVQELSKFLKGDRVETASFTRGLVYVSNQVATLHESKTFEVESNMKKAMPVIDTMLTKDIRMKKKTTTGA